MEKRRRLSNRRHLEVCGGDLGCGEQRGNWGKVMVAECLQSAHVTYGRYLAKVRQPGVTSHEDVTRTEPTY